MSLLRRLRKESDSTDREITEEEPTFAVPSLFGPTPALPEIDLLAETLARSTFRLPQRFYRMTLKFMDWRVVAYREEHSGAYLLPVESCGRLIKYELQRLEPQHDFVITTKRFADGENRVIIKSDLSEKTTEAMQEICDRYCGTPYNRKSGIVTIKPPFSYDGCACYFMCSAVEWDRR